MGSLSPLCAGGEFPENRENNREFFKFGLIQFSFGLRLWKTN
jgi:hypothetical protein